MITFACSQCGCKLRAAPEKAGKKARCPKCSHLTPIPHLAAASLSGDGGTSPDSTASAEIMPGEANDAALAATLPPAADPNNALTATLPPGGTQPEAGVAASGPVAIPGYEIIEELGRGGMGVIYKARQQSPRRLVALKMILSGEYADAGQVARFRTEAEAVARLQHSTIVQIHEVSQHRNRPYLTLEYIDGGNLAQYLKQNRLQPRQSAQLVQELARGVHFAHQRGIIHRDLKPANVLLSNQDESKAGGLPWRPKIADFGLAKALDDKTSIAPAAARTQSGAILGTPNYMSPEQARGKISDIGPLADVYALGAILYELLTGKAPFDGESTIDTLMKVATQEPVPPRQLQPKIPRDLETICLKCLRKEPGQRYENAKALADDLRCFLDGEPIAARSQGSMERVGRWLKHRKELVYLAGGGLLALCLILVLVFVNLPGAANNPQAQKPPDEEEIIGDDDGPGLAEKIQRQAAISTSQNNLKQMGIAMHTFHDLYLTLPPPAIVDRNTGQPLLSWRVAILPYVEQDNFYKAFRLDEPWDSDHNKQFLEQMPEIYKINWGEPVPKGHTYYQVFNGPKALFEPTNLRGGKFGMLGRNFVSITDGTSNTIMIAEASRAVPWTKPEDIPYDPAGSALRIGAPFGDICNLVMADGFVRSITTKVNAQTLHAMITRNGGEVVPDDWAPNAPVNGPGKGP